MDQNHAYTFETDYTDKVFFEKLNNITLSHEQLNYVQFKGNYRYKGKITETNFELEDITAGYRNPTCLLKGIITTKNNKAVIHLTIENIGNDFSHALFFALILPIAYIVTILLFMYNDNIIINLLSLLITFLMTFVLIQENRKPKLYKKEFEKFKENITRN